MFSSQSFAAQITGTLKWKSGKPAAKQDLKVDFKSYNPCYVKTDPDGNFTATWSGGSSSQDTIKIFWNGKIVYEGFITNGNRIVVHLPD